jgi:hypothetical protein
MPPSGPNHVRKLFARRIPADRKTSSTTRFPASELTTYRLRLRFIRERASSLDGRRFYALWSGVSKGAAMHFGNTSKERIAKHARKFALDFALCSGRWHSAEVADESVGGNEPISGIGYALYISHSDKADGFYILA